MQDSLYRIRTLTVTIFTIAVVFFSACGKLELGEFEPYVKTFESEARERGLDVSVTNLEVKREVLNSKIRAQCRFQAFGTPVIAVNEKIWEKASKEDREALLMHELGHCVLGRVHKEGELPDGNPASLMRSVSPYGKSYIKHRGYYLDELFR